MLKTALIFSISNLYLSKDLGLGLAPEPWLPLHGGAFSNPPVPLSPDPLISYVWPLVSTNDTLLQIFSIPAVSIRATPSSSFVNTTSAIGSIDCSIKVQGQGQLIIDFGVEAPAWIEFDSKDLQQVDAERLVVASGEYSDVNFDGGGYKEDVPKIYGSSCGSGSSLCTYRLETNSELYEGVRFAFLTINSPLSSTFTITALRLVSQAKPVNYVGSFHSAGDPLLEKIWYTGAYTVRATMQSDYMGSILEDRGDRQSWTGDAYPTQMTSMIVFSNYKFVLENLNRTSCIDCSNGIATYALYFILSTLDYYRETGDITSFQYFVPVIVEKLKTAQGMFNNPKGLRFVGHDDRLGNGFCNNTTPETQQVYRYIAIRCFNEFGAALISSGVNQTLGAYFQSVAENATQSVRYSTFSSSSVNPWYKDLFLHSATDAINAGIVNDTEKSIFLSSFFNDIVVLPSHSNFQQYFILQAQAILGALDMAVESARVIWGSEINLGATSFWEISHPDLASILTPGPSPIPNEAGWCSLAHPWSSGITPWLTKYILGIRPLVPGYTRVLIAPHVAHTMYGVSGSVGTIHGIIHVNATRAVEGVSPAKLRLVLPIGVNEAVVRLSSVLIKRLLGVNQTVDLSTIVVNGSYEARIVYPNDSPLLDETLTSLGRASALELIVKGGMEHNLLISTKDNYSVLQWEPLGSPFPPPSWPGQFLGTDATTQGNWVNNLGLEGYILFGYDDNSSDATIGRISLPSFIDRVEIFTSENSGFNDKIFTWPSNSTSQDVRALQDPKSPSTMQRRLGALAPSGSGSALVDVFVNPNADNLKYKVSAYMCDFGPTPWGDGQVGENRTQEVYLLTGYPELNPLTPRQKLSDFSQGVWFSYIIEGSFRFRVTTIRGDYAVLSALVFDIVKE